MDVARLGSQNSMDCNNAGKTPISLATKGKVHPAFANYTVGDFSHLPWAEQRKRPHGLRPCGH